MTTILWHRQKNQNEIKQYPKCCEMQFKLCKLCVRVLLMTNATQTEFPANTVCIHSYTIVSYCLNVGSFRFVQLLNFPNIFFSLYSLHGYCSGVKFSWVRRSFIMLNSMISNNSKFCDMCFINAIENGIEQNARASSSKQKPKIDENKGSKYPRKFPHSI